MQEQIGNATLTYEETYAGLENVCPEDRELAELVEQGYSCRQGEKSSWPVLYHLSHLRANLTEWLPIKKEDSVLVFGSDSGQLLPGFIKKAGQILCLDKSVSRSRILARRFSDAANLEVRAGHPWELLKELEGERYDWIIAPDALQEVGRAFRGGDSRAQAIRELKKYLKPEGHLTIAVDNRFGLKYWAGAMETHTGRYFDSLEGAGSTSSKRELEQALQEAGFEKGQYQFYYPYPERWFPSAIYSDDWLPRKGELNKNLRNFEGERLLLFDEEKVYNELIEDGRFPEFSNAYLVVTGPRAPEHTIFVKYSNDRAEEYSIRTDITEGQKGRRVRKLPLGEAAREQVAKTVQWEEPLRAMCEPCGVRVNHCLELDEGCAYFEYLEGRSFEERLDSLHSAGDYEGLTNALLEYRGLLARILQKSLTPFKKSEAFAEMFGNPDFPREYEGSGINNLDWIFSNLLETEEGIELIDYEWTFPVQVPVEYLLWRALSLYLHSREDLKNRGYMELLGISPSEERIFGEMEHHFQRWLLHGMIPIGEQYIRTAGRTLSLEELTASVKKNRIQIYTDTGAGFSETDSFYLDTEPDKQGVVRLEAPLPPGTRGVRLDPAEEPCLVKLRRLAGELGGAYEFAYIHNGRELESQGILYTTTDPQILVTNLVEGTGRIFAELTVETLHPDTAYACMELLNRVRAAERLYRSKPFQLMKKVRNKFRK